MNKIIHIFSLGLISVSMLMNTSCGKSIPAEQTIDIVPPTGCGNRIGRNIHTEGIDPRCADIRRRTHDLGRKFLE